MNDEDKRDSAPDEHARTEAESEHESEDAANEAPSPDAGGLATVRRHRISVRILLALATILGFFAMFSVWINRQVLNTDDWVSTSSKLLENKKIQQALGPYLVDQLYANVDVEARLAAALPPPANKLAGPAAAGLQQLANKAVLALLEKPQTQDVWREANRVAHKQLLTILGGGGKIVSTNNGTVTLNTRELVNSLAQQVGISQSQVNAARAQLQGSKGQAAKKTVEQKTGVQLPPNTGQLVILRSNNLKTAQDVASGIRHLAIWLTILTLLGFALAVYLARGWRRETLRSVGLCFLGLGLVVLFLRNHLGDSIVDSLVKNPSAKPAGQEVWTIATSLLVEICQAMIGYGVVIFLAAWVAGPTRLATGIRRSLAPSMRERVGVVYGVVAFVLLLVLLWGPTRATTEFWPALILILLVVLGVELLRRKTVREFPDAQRGDTLQRWRDSIAKARERRGSAEDDRVTQIERLSELHDKGALTDEEFASEKAALLAGG